MSSKFSKTAKRINSQIKTWEKKSPIVAKTIKDKMMFFDAMTKSGNLTSEKTYGSAKFEMWYTRNFGSYKSAIKDLQYKEGINGESDALAFLEMKEEYKNKLNEMYGRSSEATAVLHRHITDESMSMTDAKDFLDSWSSKINTKKGREQLGKWQLEQMLQ